MRTGSPALLTLVTSGGWGGCWEPWEQGGKLGGSIKVPTCIWQRSIKARIPAKHHSSPKREKKIPRRSSQRPTVINRRKRPPMRTSTVWIWPCRLKRCCRCSSVGRGCHFWRSAGASLSHFSAAFPRDLVSFPDCLPAALLLSLGTHRTSYPPLSFLLVEDRALPVSQSMAGI